jgi:hypothetical protein
VEGRFCRSLALYRARRFGFMAIMYFRFFIFLLPSSADTGYRNKIATSTLEQQPQATQTRVGVKWRHREYSNGSDEKVPAET